MEKNIVQNSKDELVAKDLKDIKQMFETSIHLFELGAKDSISCKVEEMRFNPVRHLFNSYVSAEEQIINILGMMVEKLFSANKELIHSAYKTNESQTVFHYSIVLKDDAD